MIKTNLVFLMIALLVFGVNTRAAAEHEVIPALFVEDQSPAGKTVSAFHQALESNDPKTARSLLADNVLIFEGGVERSADEYADHHMIADMKYLAAVESKIIEHRMEAVNGLATSIMRSKVTGSYDSKKIDYEGLETMVLRQFDGQWKITHIHWSN